MSKYLVMKCVSLDDQYECDADREPIGWYENINEFKKAIRGGKVLRNYNYNFEVWRVNPKSNNFICISDYEQAYAEKNENGKIDFPPQVRCYLNKIIKKEENRGRKS